MALEVTQVHRNLHQRVTWLYLEIEDMFLVLVLLCYKRFKVKDLANSAISSVWNGCT